MKKIHEYIFEYWYFYLTAVICLVIYVALDMVAPRVTKLIIDRVIGEGHTEILLKLLLTLAVIGIGRAVLGYIKDFFFDKTSFRISVEIRRSLFRHVQSLPIDYFAKVNTGETMARLKEDVDQLQFVFGYIGMLFIQMVIHTCFVLYCMFTLNAKLSLLPVIILPLGGLIGLCMEKKLNTIYQDISEENARMNTVAEENLVGVRVVRAFARENYEIDKFMRHNKHFYDLNMDHSRVWTKYNPAFTLLTRLLPILAVLFGGMMVIKGEITMGTLGAYVEYCYNAVWPLGMLGWLSNEIARGSASKKKIDKVFAQKPFISEEEAKKASEFDNTVIKGNVTFKNVSLTLDDNEILSDISFDIKAGKTLGIMGATGAGKTSIVNLVMRFFDPTKGEVLLDGIDVKRLPIKKVRRSVAAVMQDVFLFSDTITENIKLGKKENTAGELIDEALKASCSDEFVDHLSDKTETVIGERGVGLSGGQKQRLSMARAFAKKDPILVFDDSTSALDMETEQDIQKRLSQLKDVTKIIIAHRISSVRFADEIIILENGHIKERGNHESLMAQKGYYYETYMAQYGEFREA
ncbi:MAG: ABC transporter ATP-binding protein/permease [Lachnospiraceae bacterium]|nr:ABC transporter ATP-binding protein/permease [Lachnospiraceae bacterium]